MDVYRPHISMVSEVLAKLGASSPKRRDLPALVRAGLEDREGGDEQLSIPAMLQAASYQCGVELWRLRLSPAEVFRTVRRSGPVAAILPDNGGVIVVEAGGLGRVQARVCTLEGHRTERILSGSDLARRLGLESNTTPVDWLSRRPRLPLASVARQKGQKGPVSTVTRLWALSLLELRDLRAAFVYAVGIALLSLAVPLTVQTLISQALAGVLWQPAIILTIILLVTLTFRSFLEACEALIIEAISRRVFVRVARDFASRIVRLGKRRPEDLQTRLAAHRIFDGATIEKGLAAVAYDGFAGVLTVVATVTLLTVYHPLFALAGFIVIVFSAFIVLTPARRATKFAHDESKAKHAIAVEIDVIGARPELFAGKPSGEFALGEIEHLIGKWTKARSSHFRVFFRQLIGLIAMQVLASTALLAIGAWLIYTGELTVGQLVAGELMMTAALVGVSRFGKLLPKLYDLLAALGKVAQALDLPQRAEAGLKLPDRPLSVSFGGDSPRHAIQVPAGARVFIHGDTDVLEELFNQLSEGATRSGQGNVTVRIDGRAASAYRRASLGEQILWIAEPFTIPGTLFSNLKMADPGITDEEAWALLDTVGFKLADRKGGVHAKVGPDGEGLSRTERIRLTIARAIASRPGVLIVDGLLDRLGDGARLETVRMLSRSPEDACPWTLFVSSADTETGKLLPWDIEARPGGTYEVHRRGQGGEA